MDPPPDQPAARWRHWRRRVGYPLAAALLLAGLIVAAAGADWAALARAPWPAAAGLLGLVALNVLLTGAVYTVLTRPFEPPGRAVGWRDMQALLAASTLANYLPLKPGLVGRAAYLKRAHGIGYGATAGVFALVVGLSAAVYAVVLIAALAEPWLGRAWWVVAVVAAVGAPLALAGVLGDRLAAGRAGRVAAAVLRGAPLRVADLAVTAGRVALAFAVAGLTLSAHEAAVVAAAGMFVTLTGLTPNGLGLREWLYGLMAAAGMFAGEVEGAWRLALTAALIDRAAEVLVIAPAGAAGFAWLGRRPGSTGHA